MTGIGAGAGIPDEVQFATKVQMAREMLARALDAGVPVGWVTMDEAYGQSKSLRVWLDTGMWVMWSRPAATTT